MYTTIHDFFADKTGGETFTCFSLWHFFYIFLAVAAIAFSLYFTKNKGIYTKERLLKIFIGIAFGLYMLDFFLMPFAYGEIYVEKLPFHACTSMSIMCFISRNCKALRKFRLNFALLGLLSNLAYLCYPSGVASYEIHPLSYRAVQTLLFHAAMVVYCILTLLIDEEKLSFKHWYRDIALLCSLTVWAMIGNTLYSGKLDSLDYSEDLNWFFVKQDPFYALPADIAPYIAPWLNIIGFLSLEMIIRSGFVIAQKIMAKKQEPKQPANKKAPVVELV